jgi:hypothetical protein
VSTEKIVQLKEATKNDNELCALKQIIKTGWPESKDVWLSVNNLEYLHVHCVFVKAYLFELTAELLFVLP